jgi:hypothetical protein
MQVQIFPRIHYNTQRKYGNKICHNTKIEQFAFHETQMLTANKKAK